MRTGIKLLLLVCALPSGCGVKLPVPDGIVVKCETDAQCPSGWLCKPATGLCVIANANEPPRLVLRAIERACATPPCAVPAEVAVPVTVFDAEGDTVELTVEVDLGVGYVPAQVTGTTVEATAAGVDPEVRWQAQAQLGDTSYRSGLRLRFSASDAHGPGPAVESVAFAWGNDAPGVTALTVDDASVSGLTVIRFAVTDDAMDAVQVGSLELSLDGTFADAASVPLDVGVGASFPSGALAGLATAAPDCTPAPCGVTHTLTWDSRIAAPVDVPAARLRLVVTDVFGGASSPAFASDSFEINNANTPPQVVLTASPSGTIKQPVATVGFEIQDADLDLCALAAELSIDGGATWTSAASASPTVGLTSCKLDTDSCAHTFDWQTSQIPGGIYADVRLRLRVSDGKMFGAWVTTPVFEVDTHAAAAPLVQFEAVGQGVDGRPLIDVPFVVRVFDDDSDLVTLAVDYSVESVGSNPVWVTATLDASAADLAATPTGVAHPFTWQALVDAQAVSGDAFETVQVDTNADGSTHATVLAARVAPTVTRLRITPTDETARTGISAVFIVQALGNSVPHATMSPPVGPQAKDVPLQFEVEDGETDNVRVALQFRQNPGDTWRSAKVKLGSTTDLVTDASGPGRPYLVLWDSLAAVNDVTLTAEQGIGSQNLTAVEIRVRAVDAPIVGTEHFGPWSAAVTGVTVRNLNIPPTLVLSSQPGATESGDVTVTYTLSDEESDPVILLVEYWTAANGDWREAQSAAGGDGIVDLTSSPGGTAHTYAWSSSQVGYDVVTGVRLRLTVFDSQQGGSQTTTTFDVDNRNLVNSPPSVSVGTIAPAAPASRYMNVVQVPFIVSDPNGVGVGTDTVSVAVQYSTDGSTWHSATRHSTSDPVSGLTAAPGGSTHKFVWDAIADLNDVLLDTGSGDGVGDTATVVGTLSAQLRFTPTDSSTAPKTGAAAISSAFALGNDAPVATITLLPSMGGDYAVQFQVQDTQSDLSDVQFQFRQSATDVWRAAKIGVGAVSQLATTPTGTTTYVALWTSEAPRNDTDLAAEQGVGYVQLSTVQLRMRARDNADGVTSFWGAWSTPRINLTIDNQTPPRVETVYVKNDGDTRTGAVPIVYRLVDEESDWVDVRIEFSLDYVTWLQCTEYYAPESEGLYNLQAVPADDISEAGVHTFIWDTRANLFLRADTVQVRITAHDGVEEGPGAIVIPATVVGPPDVAPNGGRFEPRLQVDTGLVSPNHPVLVDLNGDGALDIVVADAQFMYDLPRGLAGQIAVLTGDQTAGRPDGTFTFVNTFSLLKGAETDPLRLSDIAVADFNGDGIDDVAAVTYDAQDLRIMLGGGSGGIWDTTFTVQTPTHALTDAGTSYYGYNLAVADLDGDGTLDIVVAATTGTPGTSHGFFVFLGLSGVDAGKFGAPTFYPTYSKGPVAVGDFDGQNGPDIAYLMHGNSSCPVLYYPGQAGVAAGTFPVQLEHSDSGRTGCNSMTVADLNGDGLDDLALTAWASPDIYTSISTGTGFVATTSGSVLQWGRAVAVADVNNDGINDLIATEYEQKGLTVLLGQAKAGIPTNRLGNAFPVQHKSLLYADTLAVGDLNDDGYPDVVVGTDYDGKLDVVLSASRARAGAGTFAAPRTYEGSRATSRAVVEDADADGTLDLGVYYGYMLNRREGLVGTGQLSPVSPGSLGTTGAGDLNNDGLVDRLLYASVQLRSGPPPALTFGSSIAMPITNVADEAVLDMNQNGRLDLVVTGNVFDSGEGRYVPHAWVLAGNGAGGFTTAVDRVLDTSGDSGNAVLVGHLNSDRYADFAVVMPQTGLHVFLSNGAGTFDYSSAATYANLKGAIGALCDVNNDGVLDVWVAANNAAIELALGLDTGTPGEPSGAFSGALAYSYAITEEVTALPCVDLDGDGNADLLVSHSSSGTFRVFLGHGDGTFDAPVSFATTTKPAGFVTADLDSDGTLDVAATDMLVGRTLVHTTRQEDARYQWLRSLSPWGAATPRGTYVGGTTLSGGHTRFGATDLRFDGTSMRRWHGVHEAGYTAAQGTGWGASFKDLLLQANLTPPPPAALLPVTDAWYASGDLRLSRGKDPRLGGASDTGYRIRVEPRLGPRTAPTSTSDFTQAGLSLSGSWTAQRGLVAHLPIKPEAGVLVASKLHVYRRVTDWLRADELDDPGTGQPFDPMGSQTGAHAYLPRVWVGADALHPVAAWHDVVQPKHVWLEIPSTADLTVGTGPRFDVHYTVDGQGYVRVLTDRLGVFQAYYSP